MQKISAYFRIVIALVLVLSVLGFSATTALADKPEKGGIEIKETIITNDMCSFPIEINATYTLNGIRFYNGSGAVAREFDHVVEVDVYSANGNTLTSDPYTYNIQYIFDSSGNKVHEYVSGMIVSVPLPDGSAFLIAGRVDFLNQLAESGGGVTEEGQSVNLDAFCAALAP